MFFSPLYKFVQATPPPVEKSLESKYWVFIGSTISFELSY